MTPPEPALRDPPTTTPAPPPTGQPGALRRRHGLRRGQRVALLVGLGLLGLGLVAWLLRTPAGSASAPAAGQPVQAAQPPVPVVTGNTTLAADEAQIDVLGSALALRSVTLFAAVPGEVATLHFRAGQRVAAGQVLLRLIDRSQRLALDTALARLDAARRLQARYEATRGTGAVPGSIIDEALSAVELAEIDVRQAREALADRVLRAPFAGVVGIANFAPGDRLGIDSAVTTLDDRRSILVDFEVPETYLARLRPGQQLQVANPAFGARRFNGRIEQIDSRVNVQTRSLRLRAAVPNADDLLRPGMSLQVRIDLPGATHPAVPELALQWGRDGAFVWTVRERLAVQVPVRPLRRAGDRVLVDGALREGEVVVVEGVPRLRPGRAVEVLAAGDGSVDGAASAPAGAGAQGEAPAGAGAQGEAPAGAGAQGEAAAR